MICTRDRIFLHFDEYTEEELLQVSSLLTWENEYSNENETFLFYSPEGKPYSFWGFYDLIAEEVSFPMKIKNQRQYNLERIKVSKNILPPEPDGWFKELAGFQIASAEKSLMFRYGLNEIPTGGGKTEIMLAVLRSLINMYPGKEFIVTVPSKYLAEQFKKRAFKRGFTQEEIGVLHGTCKEWGKTITVAVAATLNLGLVNGNSDIINLLSKCFAILFDEVHHLRSQSWLAIALACANIEYLLGYSGSATHEEEVLHNAGDALIYGLTGRPIYRISPSYLRSIGFIAEPVVFFQKIGGRAVMHHGQWASLYKRYIVDRYDRNDKIQMWSDRFVKLGFPILILVQRKEHAALLMRRLSHHRIISVFGGDQSLHWENGALIEVPIDYGSFADQFEDGAYDITIGSQTMDEGADLPAIGFVIMAGAGKSKIKTLQRLGRGIRRKHIGPNKVYILDFQDNTHVYMKSHSGKRREIYVDQSQATIIEDQYAWFNMAVAHSKELQLCQNKQM